MLKRIIQKLNSVFQNIVSRSFVEYRFTISKYYFFASAVNRLIADLILSLKKRI